jgi:hypothetical protein
MDQYHRSQLPVSQATVQYSPEYSSWVLVLNGGQAFATPQTGHLVPDPNIYDNRWNSSQFLPMAQQHPSTVGQVSLLFTWVYRRSLNILAPI